MLRYGTYIFGADDSLYVVIDDGACLGPQPDRTNAKCVFRCRGGAKSLIRAESPSNYFNLLSAIT